MRYTTVKVSGIIIQIAKETNVKGFTEGVIEAFLPDENTLTHQQEKKWIKENNTRMEAICNFLNNNSL